MRISDWSSDVCSSDLLLGNNVRLPIPAGESAITAIYLGVDGLPASRLLQRVALAAEPAVKSAHDSWLLLSGAFGGALAASMLYNLLLPGGVRHRLQLIYLSWLNAMLAYGDRQRDVSGTGVAVGVDRGGPRTTQQQKQ